MQLHTIALPASATLYFGEEQDFSLYLSEEETIEVKSLLSGSLVVLVDDAAVNFFLGNKELGFSFAAIKQAKLSVIKEEDKVWIVLMAILLKTNQPFYLFKMDANAKSAINWFIEHKEKLESYIGASIAIQDIEGIKGMLDE